MSRRVAGTLSKHHAHPRALNAHMFFSRSHESGYVLLFWFFSQNTKHMHINIYIL